MLQVHSFSRKKSVFNGTRKTSLYRAVGKGKNIIQIGISDGKRGSDGVGFTIFIAFSTSVAIFAVFFKTKIPAIDRNALSCYLIEMAL